MLKGKLIMETEREGERERESNGFDKSKTTKRSVPVVFCCGFLFLSLFHFFPL